MSDLTGVIAALVALVYAVMRFGTPIERRNRRAAWSVGAFMFVCFVMWKVLKA